MGEREKERGRGRTDCSGRGERHSDTLMQCLLKMLNGSVLSVERERVTNRLCLYAFLPVERLHVCVKNVLVLYVLV